MFTTEDLDARIHQRPFIPFRIVTSAGQQFDIYHPDLIMAGRRALIVGTASSDDPKHFDLVTQIALIHVTALQNLPVPSLPAGNGEQ